MAIEVLKNNNTIEVTPSVGKMSISTLNQGFDNENELINNVNDSNGYGLSANIFSKNRKT